MSQNGARCQNNPNMDIKNNKIINDDIDIKDSNDSNMPPILGSPSKARTVADEVGDEARGHERDARSRRYAKGWFLTYPKCPLTKEQMLERLKTKFKILEYIICEEQHKDETPHLHAFIKLNRRTYFKKDLFDVSCDGKDYHGNYQVAKSFRAVIEYVKKGGKYISNININNALAKKSKDLTVDDFKKDPLELLEAGTIKPMQLANFVKNQAIYRMLQQKREKPPEDWFKLEKQRHFWVAGETNSGKTYWLRKQISQKPDDWFQIPKNNDWVGYQGQKNLYIDEYRGELSIQQLNSICDGGSKVNTKGGSTLLNWTCVVYVISNYFPRQVYRKVPKETVRTLFSRFQIYGMQNHELGEPIGTDIWEQQLKEEKDEPQSQK